ncbi:PH domain-containing protein [Entamoeba marina]
MSELKVGVTSLRPSDFECWGKKCGGSIKSWKRRFFILKDHRLWYFTSQKDNSAKGYIEVPVGTNITDVSGQKKAKNKKNALAVDSEGPKGKRTFVIICENQVDFENLLTYLKRASMEAIKAQAPSVLSTKPIPTAIDRLLNIPESNSTPQERAAITRIAAFADANNGRKNLVKVRDKLAWFAREQDLTEFWKYWVASIPTKTSKYPLEVGTEAHYLIVVSSQTERLSWRVFATQSVFIQPMVTFFYSVNAPEEEIDRLNDLGGEIQPSNIGSWVDVSNLFGMDGGWFFPGEFDISVIGLIAEECKYVDILTKWVQESGITQIVHVGRDMGCTPPRLSEFRFVLEGALNIRIQRLNNAIYKFSLTNFPPDILSILNTLNEAYTYFIVNVIVCLDGFVRFGVFVPNPTDDIVHRFLNSVGTSAESQQLHDNLSKDTTISVQFVECSYLNNGFGYGVYKEGWDVNVHYYLGADKNN